MIEQVKSEVTKPDKREGEDEEAATYSLRFMGNLVLVLILVQICLWYVKEPTNYHDHNFSCS